MNSVFWELFISFRYLKPDKKHIYINICNILAALGIFLGVLSLVLVISMMSGLERNIKDALFSYQPDIVISKGSLSIDDEISGKIRQIFDKYEVFDVYRLPLIAKKDLTFKGIDLYGVDKEYLERIFSIKIEREPFFFIGKLLSLELALNENDDISLLLPFSRSINAESVSITNIFESKLVDIDLNNVFIHRKSFLKLFGIGSDRNEIHIKGLTKRNDMIRAKAILESELNDNYAVSTVFDMNRELFSAMKLEKIAMIIMLSIIILLGCFNIISSLLMLVTEKIQDIGILRAIGAKKISLQRIFALQGIAIGFISTAAGIITGIILSIILDKYQLLSISSQGLYLDYIPFRVDFIHVLLIFILSLAINIISTYIPTKNISNLTVIKALYYGR